MKPNLIATRFLGAETVAAMIARKGIAACIAGLADYSRDDFRRWASFDKSARVATHSPHGVIELMPVSERALYAFKYVNGHPGNHRFGLSTVMAFGVLAEVETGLPLLLSELNPTTALRTAAMSAGARSKRSAKPASEQPSQCASQICIRLSSVSTASAGRFRIPRCGWAAS